MNGFLENAPFVALIDDDQHSAQLLTRMLLAHGAPEIRWYGAQSDAQARLTAELANPRADRPGLIIVDLKAHSGANVEFLRSVNHMLRQSGILAVAMVQPVDQSQHDSLRQAGAAAIFNRHAELAAYRREAASLVSFWARSQRLEAVGM